MDPAQRYRCRRIYLKQCDDPTLQAHSACEALASIEGILLASPSDSHSLHVIYSLDKLSFEIVIDLLNELQFETADSLLISVRNTIFGFLEDNARDNMHVDVTQFQHEDGETAEVPPHEDDEKYWDDYH